MRTDRQTDRQTEVTKLTAAFRNFAKTPKNKKKITAAKAFTRPREVTVTNFCVLSAGVSCAKDGPKQFFSVLLPAREIEPQQLQDLFL